MGEELSPYSIRTQKVPSMVEALANLTGFFRLWKEGCTQGTEVSRENLTGMISGVLEWAMGSF